MIAGLLPNIATDLNTSIVATGQLVTVFALAYALSSPILTALTGSFHRHTLMILSPSTFAVHFNVHKSAHADCLRRANGRPR
jgi:predicted MFS family arabinose efflux permease